jgi:ABC-2 type transport system ATP-binding protein
LRAGIEKKNLNPYRMITLEGVTKLYGRKPAVDSLDLAIPPGSIFGLIGPNGAGKTTTLKMAATLIKPDQGKITVCGHDLRKDARGARRILGYMPDSFGAFGGLTCEEYLQFFGRIHGYRGGALASRIDQVSDLTDLARLRDQAVSALSTGMRQRLCLAKTLLHDPEVLILDEPASGLDPRARIEIRSLLKELGRMGKTVVISSHILADLEEISTDVAIVEEGKLVWAGSLDSIRKEIRAQRLEASIEVPEESAPLAVDVLKRLEFVESASAEGGAVKVKMRGRHGNRLLATLIDQAVEIHSYSEEKVDLEAIFLERTRGIVS